ncbi:MAG TPA: hypothetical protein VKP61_11185 [Candidatus Acidoferrum sp.]|nr:hypothetical protein [Candidatus Acidoferrum sp.]
MHTFDAQAWQDRQMIALDDIFDKAVDELDAAGVRLLTGSLPPRQENLPSVAQITIIPVRYANSNDNASFALSLSATATNGPGRYIVTLRTSGEEPHQALKRLTDKNSDVWCANYLGVGLWIHDGEHMEHLNRIEQIKTRKGATIAISGVILHSSSGYVVRAGLMSIAVVYRSLLDELSDASKMAKLSNCVLQQLDGQRPSYDRVFRP